MSKTKTVIVPSPEIDALLAVKASCAPLALSCTAVSLMTPPDERRVWQRSREEIIDTLVLTDRRLDQIWRRPSSGSEFVGSVPAQWIPHALDAVATVSGVARLHESRYGSTPVCSRLAEQIQASRSALTALDQLHRRPPLACAETETMIERAARRAIRPRGARLTFDVGVADSPSYVVRPGAVHTVRVTPRWREGVRALGTATPLGDNLLLDAWPDEGCEEKWKIVVARRTPEGAVFVQELTWWSVKVRRRSARSERIEAARRVSAVAA